MKIQKQANNRIKSLVLWSALVVLLAASGYLAFAYKQALWPFKLSSVDISNTPSNQSKSTPSTTDDASQMKATDDGKIQKGSNIDTNTGSDSTTSTVNMSISAANQDGTTVYIRTLIEAVTSSGACTLTMTGPDSKTYTNTAKVQALASSSTCQGFNIPTTSLSKGTWNFTITFENTTQKGSASGTITIT